MANTHYLKTWPIYYHEICTGHKTFEIRKNDRDFQEGDTVILQEWCPDEKNYTGNQLSFSIGTLIDGEWGVKNGHCAFSLLPISSAEHPLERKEGDGDEPATEEEVMALRGSRPNWPE